MGIFCLTIVATVFYLIKRRLWLDTVWHDTAAYAYSYNFFGNDILRYFSLFGRALGTYILAVTYHKSPRAGNAIFDAVLIATGFMVYFLTNAILGSVAVSVASASLFYFVWITPGTFEASGAAPEMYSNFFAVSGLLIVVLAVKNDMLWGVIAGSMIASLGFWVKISTFEHLWALVYLAIIKGMGAEFIVGMLSQIFMAGVLILLTSLSLHREKFLVEESASLISKIKELFEYIRNENTQPGTENHVVRSEVAKKALNDFQRHLGIVFPLVIGYLLFLALPSVSMDIKVVTVLWISTNLIFLIRLKFFPLYFLMALYPMAMGSSFVIVQFWPAIYTHPVISACILITLSAIIYHNFQEAAHWPVFKENFAILKKRIIDELAPTVTDADYIFQDTGYPQIYLHLDCLGPPTTFLWVDRLKPALANPKRLNRLFSFFIEKRPKYYLAIGQTLNLSYLEKKTGLKYEPIHAGFGLIYQLCSQSSLTPHDVPGQGYDVELLFASDKTRYSNDLNKVISTAASTTREGIQHLNTGHTERALAKFNQVQQLMPQTPKLHLLKAKALKDLGNLELAYSEIKSELAIQPSADGEKLLAEIIHQIVMTDHGLQLDTIGPKAEFPLAKAIEKYRLGQRFLEKRQVKQAINAFSRALALEPRLKAAASQLAILYWEKGAEEKALGLGRQSWELDPEDLYATLSYGEMLAKADRLEEARHTYQHYLAKRPNDKHVQLALESLPA